MPFIGGLIEKKFRASGGGYPHRLPPPRFESVTGAECRPFTFFNDDNNNNHHHRVCMRCEVMRDEFREEPSDVELAAGHTATLRCRPPRAEPEPQVTWNKDGRTLPSDGDRVYVDQFGSLHVVDARRDDSGRYSCVAENLAGQRHSAPARLVVRGDWPFSLFTGGLGRLAVWHLSGGPVGPPAKWVATSNVEGGCGTERGLTWINSLQGSSSLSLRHCSWGRSA